MFQIIYVLLSIFNKLHVRKGNPKTNFQREEITIFAKNYFAIQQKKKLVGLFGLLHTRQKLSAEQFHKE